LENYVLPYIFEVKKKVDLGGVATESGKTSPGLGAKEEMIVRRKSKRRKR